MDLKTNIVTLVVNGREYGGWKSVSITPGIERVARDFSLAITRSWPNAPMLQRAVQPFDTCEVYIGSDLVLTGDIDATPISYDAAAISVSVNGRSKTARLVDCSASNEPGQWNGLPVEKIVSEIAAVYGVTVKADVSTGGTVIDHQIQPGESAFESIDRLLQLRQLLATDNARGELLLTQAGSVHSGASLVLDGDRTNVLSGSASLDFKDVYSRYTCKGQRGSTETDDDEDPGLLETINESSASTTDTAVPYARNLIIKQSGQADAAACADRVRYERDYRRAKALSTQYTVQGWRKSDGILWLPNQLVRVRDGIIGIDADWLIIELEYRLDEGGTTTVITVAPREGYVRPVDGADKKRKRGTGRDSEDKFEGVVPGDYQDSED